MGKTTTAHGLQNTLSERNTKLRKHRGNDLLSSSFATRSGYNEEATTSFFLSLSQHSVTRSVQLTLQPHIIQSMCPKSYLYTYDFRAIYINVHSDRSDRSGPVLGWAGSLFLPYGGICFPTRHTTQHNVHIEIRGYKTGNIVCCKGARKDSSIIKTVPNLRLVIYRFSIPLYRTWAVTL